MSDITNKAGNCRNISRIGVISARMSEEKPTLESLQKQVDGLSAEVTGLFHLMGLSHNNKPRSKDELRRVWSMLHHLGAKKSWTEAEVYAVIEFVWYLTQDDLRVLEGIGGKKLCWLSIFSLLDAMRWELINLPHFTASKMLHVLESRVRGALANLERSAQIYLLRYAPALKESIETYIRGHLDDVTPELDVSSSHLLPTHQTRGREFQGED